MGADIVCIYDRTGGVVRMDDSGVVLVVDEDNDERDHLYLSWGRSTVTLAEWTRQVDELNAARAKANKVPA